MYHLRTARRSTTWWVRPMLLTLILFAAIAAGVSPHFNRPVAALSPDIVISQVYGGGGAAAGSTYANDFVELFNRGTTAVDVTGWSIQYASAAGPGLFGASTTAITPLTGTLLPGQYLLVEGAVSATPPAPPTGGALPTPDVTDATPINLGGSSGKVALVTDSTPLGCNGGSTLCDAGQMARIQDLVGYGATATTPPNFFEGATPAPEPAPSASNGVQRKDGGCTETDDNGADFLEATPAPRNMTSTFNPCYPDTSIDSSPTDPSSSADASFTFSSADVGSTFECQLDSGTWAACPSPQNYTGLADGSHTFGVRATNTRGNTDPTPASWTWVIDTTPPDTTIDTGPTNPSNSADAEFTFSADEPGTFECRLDSGTWAACTTPKNYTGLADGSHTFEVRATDAANNTDPSPASWTWVIDTTSPDTTPPDTTIDTGPTNPSNSADAEFTFSADEPGTFECRLDSGTWAACTTPKNYTGLADGSHTFEVRATDAANNTDPSPASWTWVIDTTPPDTTPPNTTIDTGPTNPSNSANANFTFSADEPSTFECRLDGGAWAACTTPKNYTGLADGSHTFEVRATDAANNTDPSPASWTWVIDTTPPPTASILVSTQSAGSIGALGFGSEDILRWNGTNWSTWFDGSAAGLMPAGKAKHNINAFWTPDPNGVEVVMSFGQNRCHIPGYPFPVDGMDLMLWNGSAFSLYFDGGDVGLKSKTQEKIDALHILPGAISPINGGNCLAYLLISTQGPGRVNNPGESTLKFGGEDVLGFCMTSSGDNTAGLWHLALDGSAEGMPPNSLVNLSASDDGQVLYLTTRKNFNVDAAVGGHSMVYRFDRGTGLFSGPFFSAPAAGLAPALDGLQVMGDLP